MSDVGSPIAVAFLLAGAVGVALIALGYPHLPLSSCTDVGYEGDPPGGFEYYGVEWGWMYYSPDGGVNDCHSPAVTLTVGLLAVGGAALAVGRRGRYPLG